MSFKVIGIGEVLWDLLPSGPQLGGAPANFACHAHALGARAGIITRVGKDPEGQEIIQRIKGMGISTRGVQVDDVVPTGTVAVRISDRGVPEYLIRERVAWDHIAARAGALASVRQADAICFGSLAQRCAVSRESIRRLVSAAPADAWRVFDANLRQNFFTREIIEQSLRRANLLKLNESELPVLAEMFGLAGDCRSQIAALAGAFGLRIVVLTRGQGGSLIFQAGRWSEHPAAPATVADTVGAGDSFTAALVLGLLHGLDLDAVHAFAAAVAGFVCSCAGATPVLPENLRNHFRRRRSAQDNQFHSRAAMQPG